ncbi:uncharacterized protein IL334_002759 [Kwoniella shivajii]|uniref:BRCT domain-containing protein n=1 Tax=Kwoniella shivajii TaxID=564305 RepID=A0ABZ1CXB4_9TREE|nr:hypothetical protein IL334_002759 [Kwoniella shivajii]
MEFLLSEQKVIFAEDQFPDDAIEFLTSRISELGGKVITSRAESTILLVNPSHPTYKKELERIIDLRRTYPHISQPFIHPYHWINNVYQQKTLIKIEDLSVISPIFTYPSSFENYRPIRAWVSVNVSREQDETPEAARDSLLEKLECAGAIGVGKRAQADLLVVDESSEFAKKVHGEKRKHDRHWQKIVERDWVDNCLRERKLSWRLTPQQLQERGDEEDNESFLGDDTPTNEGKGPGRPTGKPRVEYTPQDDDFLCRYLAAHNPDGSWGSRKTYHNLAATSAQYPIAERHSAQSWHERYKKNSVSFEKRVKAFIKEGVNGTLKTKAEREKARLAKISSQAQIQDRADDITAENQNEAGPSRVDTADATEETTSSRQDRVGKRKLVESDDESLPPANTARENQQPTTVTVDEQRQDLLEIASGRQQADQLVEKPQNAIPTDESRVIENNDYGTVNLPPSTNTDMIPQQQPVTSDIILEAGGSSSDVGGKFASLEPEMQRDQSQPVIHTQPELPPLATDMEAPARNDDIAEESLTDLLPSASQLPTITTSIENIGDRTMDTDMVERDLLDAESPREDDMSQAQQTASQAVTDTADDDEESQRGEATQAILADFAKAQAEAQISASGIIPVEQHDRPPKSVRLDEEAEVRIITPNSEEQSLPVSKQQPISPRPQSPQPVEISSGHPVSTSTEATSTKQLSQAKHTAPSALASMEDTPVSNDVPAVNTLAPTVEIDDPVVPSTMETITKRQVNVQPTTAIESGISSTTPKPRSAANPSTPSPDSKMPNKKPRHSTLYDHLLASQSKRRRTLDRMSAGAADRSIGRGQSIGRVEPDMVFRETSIPPRPERVTPSLSPAPLPIPISNRSNRPPSPVLSQKERNERAIRGKELIQKSIEEYKARISNLATRYNMTNSQVVKWINEGGHKGKGGGERYWDEVEKSLRAQRG